VVLMFSIFCRTDMCHYLFLCHHWSSGIAVSLNSAFLNHQLQLKPLSGYSPEILSRETRRNGRN
jgi:hypothetical protein